ncbi:PaaX family transcriptional regulator C-terminal domain-containing protein [Tropicimonas sp. TH_r6]|uniref:PaaX family transcriptional regulator C-terminal domain-containing protein n=1 Tax=Tropicimonas sp. TH_r6 TaxID=3082085 RepID=UPI002955622F|nr:PaaX family transcriptional regulator C-terminal domain-containing protein [Tropicimonas sp. TH_r6]MDV7142351.1 PaaX family transcriptional regulator C-terminal domain-containing protein [Tropicimonas sp. TH_r6]
MEIAVSETFETCREALSGDRPHRVWSLIITIFGDIAQGAGMSLSGTQLAQITECLGVRPEAMRVALHRLRKDGWIESRRDGRRSSHALTEFGRRQCAEASPRIYGSGLPADARLHLLIGEDGSAEARRALDAHALTEAYMQLGPCLLVGLGPPPSDAEGLLVVDVCGLSVPDWVQQRVCPPELVEESAVLLSALDRVAAALDGVELTQLETEALRVLAVHSWRRLVLRPPNLPARFFPEAWRGEECRNRVRALLTRLPPDAPRAAAFS